MNSWRRCGAIYSGASSCYPRKHPAVNTAHDRGRGDARAYPVLMQQRMTDPGFQAPGQPRPQQSNCTVVGGQVNCRAAPTGVDSSIHDRPPSDVTEDVDQVRRQAAFRCVQGSQGLPAQLTRSGAPQTPK